MICRIFLEIIEKLIMFYEIEKVVYVKNGFLYRYDVIDINFVWFVNFGEIIVGDGWEK